MRTVRIAAFFLVLTVVLAGCSRSGATAGAPPAPPPPEVSVAAVIAKPLRDWEEFSGRLEAVQSVEIRPRVSGYIDAVSFTEGARVKKGQLLFRIDPRPFRAEVNRLTAALNSARSTAALNASNHDRGKHLLGQHWISQQAFDQLATTDATGTNDVASAAAALETARLNLEFTDVRSPIDGRVSRALITAGNLVSNANLLTTVVSDDPVYAYFDADEQTFLKFAPQASAHDGAPTNSPVYMGLVNEEGYPHEGHLDFLDNQVDPQSGTIRARAVFDNHAGRFTPGLFTRIKLVGNDSHDSVLIDDRAIGTDLGKKFVFALKPDNTLDYRFVELGAAIDGLRVVTKGLAAGDVIVVNGLQHVRPGMTVKPSRVEMDGDRKGVAQVETRKSAVAVATVAAPTSKSQR